MTVFWARVASFFFLLVGLQSSSCLSLGFQTSLADKEKSLLWKISGNGLSAPSYLFRTIQFIGKDHYLSTTEMQHALDESSHIAMELEMDEPGLPTELAQAMMLKEGE